MMAADSTVLMIFVAMADQSTVFHHLSLVE